MICVSNVAVKTRWHRCQRSIGDTVTKRLSYNDFFFSFNSRRFVEIRLYFTDGIGCFRQFNSGVSSSVNSTPKAKGAKAISFFCG